MKFIQLFRKEINGKEKVEMRIYDKKVNFNAISTTILDSVPEGLQIGKKYIID